MLRQAPVARKIPVERVTHGDVYVDNYEWFRDKANPELIAHLEAENEWTEERTKNLRPLREQLAGEFASLTKLTDITVPIRKGGWWYYQRTWEGKEYPAVYRIPDADGTRPDLVDLAGEQLVWDSNLLSEGQEFFSTSGFDASPNGKLGALGLDFSGDEHFTLQIFDIEQGQILDDVVVGIGYGIAWTADSSAVIYSRVDDAWRSWQIWLHRVGTPSSEDCLLYQEDDDRFDLWHTASRDGRWVVVNSSSRTTSEVRLISTGHPEADPIVVSRRSPGVDYMVEPAGDHLLVVHNANVVDFELASAPIGTSVPQEWVSLLKPEPGERISEVEAFASFAVIALRSEGETELRVMQRDVEAAMPGRGEAYREAHERQVWGEPVRVPAARLSTTELFLSPDWDASEVVYSTESLLTPPTQCAYDVETGAVSTLKVQEVPGYDPDEFVQEGVWVTAADGTQIPMTIAYKAGLTADGTNPGWLYGYGSYEVANDPYFAPRHIAMLRRGVVIGWTHIRGGGEMGRAWYDNGKLLTKKNTFSDFVACGQWLIESGWVARDRLAGEGRSAGGLLIGAAVNLAPGLFRAVHAGVPFVDALTTILKPELPLTAGEWEEWGNPIESEEVYEYMKSYSPVENVQKTEYPAVLATTSLNDIRVFYVEPTKWVQVLRENATNDPLDRPILEKIEMVAGHAGKSGREGRWESQAFVLAWLLNQIGAA
ncbi:MAG: S9 family peptidase [Ancrocorticia populi]|uniref:S9 family peptidase n=1 Tax=Ancrocorticia populi TaxID=2175228 RepID=UPI003F93BB50